jgi:DNA-binding beta-propeller fold protein YncE
MELLMRWLRSVVLLVGSATCCGCLGQGRSNDNPSMAFDRLFSHVGDFPLGEAADRIDYQSLDATARLLYIAKMSAGKLQAFDINQSSLVAQRDGFPKVTGVLVVPELQKVYASVPGAGLASSLSVALGMVGLSSGPGAVAILDTAHLREIARVPGGVFPDGIAFDAKERRIFVADELGSAVLVIDADSNGLVGRVELGGEVGNVQYDPVTARVYAPIQSRDELATIDPASALLVTRHGLAWCKHPHGLALAPHEAVGYVACDGNDRLLTVDLIMGTILDSEPLAHDPDVLAIDAGARRLYVASESGNLSSFDLATAARPTPLGDVFVGEGAHSVAVDPLSHRLYFPLADLQGHSVLRVLTPKS